MALNIGSLVGQIRADDSGWRHGLQEAQIRLAGFTRMTDGTLRDMHGRVVSQSDAMGQTLGARIGRGANAAVDALKRIGPAAASMGVGIPVAAALGGALGGLAAGALAAGLATKAFSLAAKPQLEGVTEAASAAEKADAAHEKVLLKKKVAADLAAKGGDAYKRALADVEAAQRGATEADKAAEEQLKGLPPATRATAVAFAGLKGDYKAWSDSLSSTTMPVFTKGIEILRNLLPMLTPFVQAAAGAFSDMLGKIAVGTKSANFKAWAADMAAASGPALKNFLTTIGNLAKGFGSLLGAFLPASAGMTGGLADMTGRFAEWAAGLKGSEGFEKFLDGAKTGGAMLGSLASAVLKVVVALGPLIGLTTELALGFADIINETPKPVITALAAIIGTVVVAMKLWAAAQALVALRNRIWTTTQWALNASMLANPVVLIVAAIIILIGIIVLIATKTTWFQTAWSYVWSAVKTAFSAAVSGIMIALNWLSELPGKIATWFGQAYDWAVRKLTELVQWVFGFPLRIWNALASLGSTLKTAATDGFNKFRDAAILRAAKFVIWVRGLPGRIKSALGNLNSLLNQKGRDIVTGLWNGISSMGSWLAGKLTGFARSIIPGPIAKALGIASPSRVMADQIGKHIPSGIMAGIEAGAPALDRTMAGLVTPPHVAGVGAGGGHSRSAGGSARTVLEIRSSGSRTDDLILELLRGSVSSRGGNVNYAFTGRR